MLNKTSTSIYDIHRIAINYRGHFSAQIHLDNEENYLDYLNTIARNVTPNLEPNDHGIVSTRLTLADRLGTVDVSYYKSGTAKYLIGDNDVVKHVDFTNDNDIVVAQRETGRTITIEAMNPEVDHTGKLIKMRGISKDGVVVELGAAHFKDTE